MYQIEKGVPLPVVTRKGGRPCIYPWEGLQIGDSFFVPNRTSLAGTIEAAARRTGFTFKTVRVEGGIRIWRIAGPGEAALPTTEPLAADVPSVPKPTMPRRRRLTADPERGRRATP